MIQQQLIDFAWYHVNPWKQDLFNKTIKWGHTPVYDTNIILDWKWYSTTGVWTRISLDYKIASCYQWSSPLLASNPSFIKSWNIFSIYLSHYITMSGSWSERQNESAENLKRECRNCSISSQVPLDCRGKKKYLPFKGTQYDFRTIMVNAYLGMLTYV